MRFSAADIKSAISVIERLLETRVDPKLQSDFECGRQPNLLSYGQSQSASKALPALHGYLIAAASSIHQPIPYYDIFRACRATTLIQLLAKALEHLKNAGTPLLEERLSRLKSETDYDAFDSTLFELVTAWRYDALIPYANVAFIKETPTQKTPDFSYQIAGFDSACECKKLIRADNHSVRLRNAASACLNPVLAAFQEREVAVIADVDFHADPASVSSSSVFSAIKDSLQAATPIVEAQFTANARPLRPYIADTFALCPAPAFYWSRYGFRQRSEWMGIVHHLDGHHVQYNGEPLSKDVPQSTWLDEIWWDAAIKWKVSDDSILAKYRRFGFETVFKGLEQIQHYGLNCTAHVWLESDYYLGGRENALHDLFRRLSSNARDYFGWLVLNETLEETSPKGHFDLIEHAHIIEGPSAITKSAPVTLLLTNDGDIPIVGGEFGRGTELEDIDAV